MPQAAGAVRCIGRARQTRLLADKTVAALEIGLAGRVRLRTDAFAHGAVRSTRRARDVDTGHVFAAFGVGLAGVHRRLRLRLGRHGCQRRDERGKDGGQSGGQSGADGKHIRPERGLVGGTHAGSSRRRCSGMAAGHRGESATAHTPGRAVKRRWRAVEIRKLCVVDLEESGDPTNSTQQFEVGCLWDVEVDSETCPHDSRERCALLWPSDLRRVEEHRVSARGF